MGCFNSKEEDSSTNGFSNPIHGESHRSDVFVNSDSPENQKETLQKKKKENKKKGKDHKTEPSHKNEVLKRNSKELGNPTTENKKETYNPLDAQETQQHKEKRKKKTKENDHEKKSRKEKKNKPQESEEANKGKITQTDVLVVQGPEVEQKTVEGQTKSSDLHTIVYQQQTANVKTQEDQLEKENDQFHEKSMSFGKENRTEIETLEQKLKDIKEENVKALAEKDDKIQALQNERDNILAKTKENSDKNERNWKELTEQLQQKDNKIKRLEMKHKELEEELEETLARYDKTCGKREKKEAVKNIELPLKAERDKLQAELIEFKNEKTKEIERLEKRLNNLAQQRDSTVAKMAGENQVLQREKDELLLRLSEITGRRLTDNNPNIADLSDENRPTKLAEKYAELYDNEWTDAFSYLQTLDAFKDSEKLVINTLVIFLVEAFTLSTETAQGKLENLRNTLNDFYGNTSSKDGQVKDIMKQLKDQMKKVTKPNENLMKEYMDVMLKRMTSLSITSLDSGTFKPYLQKCLEISWLMAVQDPPLYLTLENCQKGQIFNRNIFKEYTKSGPFIDFVVWPAVFLEKGGPLLCKGVVQCKKSNSFRSSGSNVIPEERNRKTQSLYVKPTSASLTSTPLKSDGVVGQKTSSMVHDSPANDESNATKF